MGSRKARKYQIELELHADTRSVHVCLSGTVEQVRWSIWTLTWEDAASYLQEVDLAKLVAARLCRYSTDHAESP